MQKLDVLFLNLHRRYLNFEATYGGFLGIYYLSAFLRREYYEAKSFAGTLNKGKKILDKFCTRNKISMVGLYCDYDNVTENISISRYVKEAYNLPVIIGGPQATALDENFFRESKCDAVVLGEGELTVLELAKFFIDSCGDKLIKTPARPLIKNLDDLPFITEDCYFEPSNFYLGLNLMTGRGCPFRCAFCHQGIGNGVRFRSAENVLAEIDKYLKLRTANELCFHFTDDTFTLNSERVKKICAGINDRRKTCKLEFFCEGHVHTLCKNPELIHVLADSGCYGIQLGIESGNNHVLKAYEKNTSAEEILEVVSRCCEAGIQQIFGNIILGGAFFSEETYETDKNFTRQLLEKGKGIVELSVVPFLPLPNTQMTLCPSNFGIKVCDTEFLTSLGDFPQAETQNFDRIAIAEKQAELESFIRETMLELIKSKKIPTERFLHLFKESSKHKSAWFTALNQLENIYSYYEMLYLEEGTESKMISNLALAHPMRTISIYKHLNRIDKNFVSFYDEKFSLKELEVITLTTGKLSVTQIAEKVSLSISKVIDVLNRMEKKFLIIYSNR